MSAHVSSDGLMRSSDPEAVALWESICARMDDEKKDWTQRLRDAGIKLAHPDDGWVHRDKNTFSLSWYPQFDDRPEVGDLIAFGRPPRGERYERTRSYDREHENMAYDRRPFSEPESASEGYRICRVTSVDRHTSILGYFQDFDYEDTGVRVPPAKPVPAVRLWWHRIWGAR